MTHHFTLIEPQDYPLELERKFHNAKKHIVITAMTIYANGATLPLFDALEEALQRGVLVTIMPDSYTQFLLAPKSASQGKFIRAQHQINNTLKRLNRLQELGATVTFLGKLGLNPYKRRFHQKFTIIDGDVYCGGGLNFDSDMFEHADYMLHCTNPALAATLLAQLQDIAKRGNIDDFSTPLSPTDFLLIDGGRAGQSLIYQRALALAKEAEEIIYVSQWSPSGALATVLKDKKAVCYFNRLQPSSGPAFLAQLIDQLRYGIHNNYHNEKYLHAKYILFAMPNGNKTLLSGSHNFSQRGITYGTKELAIESSDPTLWESLASFTKKYIS